LKRKESLFHEKLHEERENVEYVPKCSKFLGLRKTLDVSDETKTMIDGLFRDITW
jgi:hypothetical protein